MVRNLSRLLRARRVSACDYTATGNSSNLRARANSTLSGFTVLILLALFLHGCTPTTSTVAHSNGVSTVLGLGVGVLLALILLWALYQTFRRPTGASWPELLFLAGLLCILTAVKLALLFVFRGVSVDINTYQAWALKLASVGPSHTYESGYFLDYPPGYLYVLWLVGWLAHAFALTGDGLRILVETPPLVADALIGAVLFVWARRLYGATQAFAAVMLFIANPGLAFDTVVWGQSDSVLTLLMLLAVIAAADARYELCWALAAMAGLVKPQGLLLVPLLAWWSWLEASPRVWARSAVIAGAVLLVSVLPFQLGRPIWWIWSLYQSTAAYYHETSVNAYNFMALLGGLRQPDATRLLGFSYFQWGLILFTGWYFFVAAVAKRHRTPAGRFLTAALIFLGSFMMLTRMHERYLYPALVFLIPVALEDDAAMVALGVLTATFLFNLYQVAAILNQGTFFRPREPSAMMAATVNMAATALFAGRVALRTWPTVLSSIAAQPRANDNAKFETDTVDTSEEHTRPLVWTTGDTLIVIALVCAAAVTRFWHLSYPSEVVFDEVHFVTQARHYLHGEPFLDPHPPLAKLLIAAGIAIFGDKPWAWRVGNAVLGTLLVGVTYLLGRRMFGNRLAGTLAASAVLFDGLFLVDSRVGVIDIVYLTFAACSYLLLFRFIQTDDLIDARRTLLLLGITLGLCLGSKLYVPAAVFLLVAGFLAYHCYRTAARSPSAYTASAMALICGTSATVYLAVFLPHFLLGWWRGVGDLLAYYGGVVWYEKSVYSATHPYSAPWWSWPLMLRPIAYWQRFPPHGDVAVIWGGGNPILWWGAFAAIAITAVKWKRRGGLARAFLLSGYVLYLAIWVPIGRTLFLYHYMPAVYCGFLALADALTQCWLGRAERWEHALLLLPTIAACLMALPTGAAVLMLGAILSGYAATYDFRPERLGRYVFVIFTLSALLAFAYFLPVWIGLPVRRAGYYARMWVEGHGIANWI